jgi:hypothetical protein
VTRALVGIQATTRLKRTEKTFELIKALAVNIHAHSVQNELDFSFLRKFDLVQMVSSEEIKTLLRHQSKLK